ncbi:hydroxymethylglutaryl-CoA reductase, degradative [Lacticaseibacillus chiayiensis]|uniref:3-hydroxy-3-methylglutaryl coenzyme A reductase n=1 Tax=Lacticaseibacillus chiayiensis TaxID=2100821 RepID=A0A4Q1UDF0_9LACO|nr:hydroxymethylglutaryl-CoA reductase, degradative [Lacticaseibacillus chiayiensis]QVI33749.1 hydroxymethylglutaryl-CoA reductase, degradative [Lacticaseibacillus chiayiensis]RXT29683.1 hydroxymethylglutaryl-CoA reductase, degradative [Lacticaseibacillus chiayiensis]UYN55494.1 hydroxymethylglutaryl-CoA reductase, degradative [Lacticaseibacillus chiayiensis]
MKFYEKTPEERRAQLIREGSLTQADADLFAATSSLPATTEAKLVENSIGEFSLPLGIARNLLVNGQLHQVPLANEEPSVVAAASNGARIAGENGGVVARVDAHQVVAEVVLTELTDLEAARQTVLAHQADIKAVVAAAHPSMIQRGGGLVAVAVSVLANRFLKIRLTLDPKAAMGANYANTVAEAVAAVVKTWLGGTILVSILTNAPAELVTATVRLDPASLATKAKPGDAIAEKIVQLSDLAFVDPERAVTHNKGILNGVIGAVLATGNDTRAVAASVGAFAVASGQYQPLSRWVMRAGKLEGTLQMPLPLGTVGGAIGALPLAQAARRLGGYRDLATMQQVMAALGLVQNLAALRALAGPGIQEGHMKLQANALAITAGAKEHELPALVTALREGQMDLAHAKTYLANIRLNQKVGQSKHENRD